MATLAYVALGSNLESPQDQVLRGCDALARLAHTRLLRCSPLYQSAPWGLVDQPDFINAVAEIETSLAPQRLLASLQRIEQAHDRNRSGPRWGPRTLDLDLLTFGAALLDEPQLVLPHPRLAERAFVLLPLCDLAPDMHIHSHGRVIDLLAGMDTTGCRRLHGRARGQST